MEILEPTLDEWKALYSAAIKFKEAGCWKWMLDSDIFGIKSLEHDEIGYCCIMGNAGEFFGLAVYEGTEGLDGLLSVQTGSILPGDLDGLHVQKCLMASFEDRSYLSKKDLNLIKKLGYKFRGRNAWPMFRNYLPGYVPWDLDSAQARFLTLALEQAVQLSLDIKERKTKREFKKKDNYLVKVQKKDNDRELWTEEWQAPEPLIKQSFTEEPIDEVAIQRIKKLSTGKQGTVEIDYFFSPSPVREGSERPFFPYVFLWADNESGFVFKVHVSPPDVYKKELFSEMLHFLQDTKIIPVKVLVKKQEAKKLLGPIASRLGFQVKQVDTLEAIEEARIHMFEFFQGGANPFGAQFKEDIAYEE